MGQTELLKKCFPELEAVVTSLVARLEALGSDGLFVLCGDPRLAAAVEVLKLGGRKRQNARGRREMGQEWMIWFQLSSTLRELESIAECLTSLGCDGFGVLRADVQLAAALTYYDDWLRKRVAGGPTALPALAFRIFSSPMLDQTAALEHTMRSMVSLAQPVRLELNSGQMIASSGPISFAIPAIYEVEGEQVVGGGFLSLLLDALRHEEWLNCEVGPQLYRVNGKVFRPRPPTPNAL